MGESMHVQGMVTWVSPSGKKEHGLWLTTGSPWATEPTETWRNTAHTLRKQRVDLRSYIDKVNLVKEASRKLSERTTNIYYYRRPRGKSYHSLGDWSTTPNEDERSTNIWLLPGVSICALLVIRKSFAGSEGCFTWLGIVKLMQSQLKTKPYLEMVHKMALWANKNIHLAFTSEMFTFLSFFFILC